MKSQLSRFGLVALSYAMPIVTFAQGQPIDINAVRPVDDTFILGLIGRIDRIIRAIVPILMGLALVFFLYGLVRFVLASRKGDPDGKTEGYNTMKWGIIALFLMVCVWGIVAVLAKLFGVSAGGSLPVPGFPSYTP